MCRLFKQNMSETFISNDTTLFIRKRSTVRVLFHLKTLITSLHQTIIYLFNDVTNDISTDLITDITILCVNFFLFHV